MSEGRNKAAKRLIKWRDSARRQLSSASCSDDLAGAVQFVLHNAAKTFKAALLPTDDERREQLSRDLSTILCQISAHLHLRSRDLVADCVDDSDEQSSSSRFAYWDHQCALLSYLLDLALVRNEPAAIAKICFVLSKSKHRLWDVLVQTWAISSSAPVRLDLQPRLLDVFRWFAAYCPRTCPSAELYFKFVVCAACLARRLPERGWETVKPVVLSIEPAEFDFEEWFAAQPALAALLPRSEVPRSRRKVIARLCKSASDPVELLEACRTLAESGGDSAGIRTTCDAAAAADADMFVIADEEVQAREQDTKTPEVEDEQLQAILDSTLSRLRSTIATPHASDAEPNSEAVSDASNSPLNTKAFLDRLLHSSVAESGARDAFNNAEASAKKLDHRQQESVEANNSEAGEVVATPAEGDKHTSVAQEATSEDEGAISNYADSTPAVSPPRKKLRRRKRVRRRKIRASSKLHAIVEVNAKLATSKTAEESDAFAASMHDEVRHETPLSEKSSLQEHVPELSSVSAVQDSDATAVLIDDQCGLKRTEQDSVIDLEEKSCKHHDTEIEDKISLTMGREEPRDSLNLQDEPVVKALKEVSLQNYRAGKAILPEDTEELGASSCSKVELTVQSHLLRSHQSRKSTKSCRQRTIESSAEESCGEEELSSVSAAQHLHTAVTFNDGQCGAKRLEQDSISDLEEKSSEHHDSKMDDEMSLSIGKEESRDFLNSQAEPVAKALEEASLRSHRTGKAVLPDNSEGLRASSSEVESTVNSDLLQGHQARKWTKSRRRRIIKSSSEESCSEQELSSVSAAQHLGAARTFNVDWCGVKRTEQDCIRDLEEKSPRHHDAKFDNQKSLTKGREEHGGHSEDTTETTSNSSDEENCGQTSRDGATETISISSDDEVAEKNDGQLTCGDVVETLSSSPYAQVTEQSGGRSQHDDAFETLSSSNSESFREVSSSSSESESSDEGSCSQGASGSSIGKNIAASSPGRRPSGTASTRGGEACNIQGQRQRPSSSLEPEYKKSVFKGNTKVLASRYTRKPEAHSDSQLISPAKLGKIQCSLATVVEAKDVTLKTVKKARRSRIVSSSESSDEESSIERPVLQEAVSSDEERSVKHSAQHGAESSDEHSVEHLTQEAKSSDKEHGVEHLSKQEGYSSKEEFNVVHAVQQEAESSDEECNVEHPAQREARQPTVFSELADDIPCGQRSPGASSLQDMHISPSESEEDGSLSPVLQGINLAAESDADTVAVQSNDEGVGRQRAHRLSQATTISASSQRRSPSPFSKLRERVMSFQEDSDDEMDTVAFGGKGAPSAGKHSFFKVPLVKNLGTPSTQRSVKSKPQDVRHSLDERTTPTKSQSACRRTRSRGSLSSQGEQGALPDKEQDSESDSDNAGAATNETANVRLNSDTMGSRHMSTEKTKALGPGMKQAGIRQNRSRASLAKNKPSKLSEVTKISELEQNGASESDSGEGPRDGNKALESGKCTTQSPSKTDKLVIVEASPSNRRKQAPCPNLLTLDPTQPKRAALKLPSDHDFDSASVSEDKESACSEHSRQNEVSARQLQEAKSEVSARRRSTRSCTKKLAVGQQKEQVFDSESGNTCKDLSDQSVTSSNLAKRTSKGEQKQGDPGDGSSTPEKPRTPSSGHATHGKELSGTQDNLSDDGIKRACPMSPMEKPTSSVTKRKSGIEAEATSRSGQLASGSLHRSSPSPIRGRTPAYEVQQSGHATLGVLTRSARRQLSYANGKPSLSQKRITMSTVGVGPDVKPNTTSSDMTAKSVLGEDVGPAPLEAKRRVLQYSRSDGHSVKRRDVSPTQAKGDTISEKESESGDNRVGSASSRHNALSPSPSPTKRPIVKLDRMQNNEREPVATVSGEKNLHRTHSVSASLHGREVDASNTTFDGPSASKERQVDSDTGDTAGLARSPLRTASKRRRVVDASMNVAPALDTFEDDSSQRNVYLSGLTQVPLSRNIHASDNSSSSDQEGGDIVHSAQQRRLSLRRLPSRRMSQRNKKEDFIIDVDEQVRSLSDSDDNDPPYEVNEVNLDASIARLRRLKVPLYTPEKEAQSRTSSAASSYKVANNSARRTGRLSLAAIRASQSESSPSTHSSLSPPFRTASDGIPEAQSPTSNLCLSQSPSRRAKSYNNEQTGAMPGRRAEKNEQSSTENKDGVSSMLEDPQTVSARNTRKSAKKMPVLRRSTRLSTKQDTSACLTCSNHLKSDDLGAPSRSSHLNKDLEVVVREQTVLTAKRNKSLKVSPALPVHAKHPDERSGTFEEASVADDASSSVCSTCNRCVKATSTQDSGTMTDDSYLHDDDDDAFSDSPRYSKRKKVGASASQSKARASRSSRQHGAATQEATVPVRRSSRTTAGASRRLSYV